jgi:hypothetical protein
MTATLTRFYFQILVLAGGCDSVASTSAQENVVLGWRAQGIPSSIKVVHGAKHCQLLLHSPQIYAAELRSFLSTLGSSALMPQSEQGIVSDAK